jgi:LDH2 family malate/lactate/ureidoglycolate dehydrogenase
MALAAERLERWVAQVFAKEGLSAEHAETVAKVLVWANLRGMDTHGVMRVPRYVEWVRSGEMNARPAMAARSDSPACVLLDADRAAGPVAMLEGARLAIAKARDAGAGVCVVRGTTHTAAIGFYTRAIAEAGMAGLAWSASVPNMAYYGAKAAGVSTAPLAIAVPAEDGVIALDIASGVVSLGRLAQARRTGEALQPGQALDRNGNETTDPSEAAIPLPLGGPKGSGLALLIECLASLLAGSPILAEVLERTAESRRHRQNGALIALDIARFVEPARFRAEAGRLARAIKALPAQPGTEVLLPGERGDRAAEKRRREGIPLPPKVHEELAALGRSLGIALE